MILCPNCLYKELVGAIFCSQCGAQLIFEEGVPTSTIKGDGTKDFDGSPSATQAIPAFQSIDGLSGIEPSIPTHPPAPTSPSALLLNIINAGESIPISDSGEITLGRTSEGQSVVPDIDLTPFKAYEAGVSRMHAVLIIQDDKISAMDLDSANGTRLNGAPLTPNIPYPLKNGDILTLGKLKIQALIRPR